MCRRYVKEMVKRVTPPMYIATCRLRAATLALAARCTASLCPFVDRKRLAEDS
jgi:hypothetical protein